MTSRYDRLCGAKRRPGRSIALRRVQSHRKEPYSHMERNTSPKTAPNHTGEYLTTGETAAQLRVSEETIRRWCRAGRLPSVQIGRAHRIPLAAVIACTAGAHSKPNRTSSAPAAGAADRGETPRAPTACGQEAGPRAAGAPPARAASQPPPLRDEPGGLPPTDPPTAYRQEAGPRAAAAPWQASPPATPRGGEPPDGRAARPATYTRKPTIIG